MSFRKLNTDAMGALALAREIADLLNNTFFTYNAQVTASTNGNANLAHGLGAAPTFAAVGLVGDATAHVDVESVTSTNIVLHFKAAADGADVTSGTFGVWAIASTKL